MDQLIVQIEEISLLLPTSVIPEKDTHDINIDIAILNPEGHLIFEEEREYIPANEDIDPDQFQSVLVYEVGDLDDFRVPIDTLFLELYMKVKKSGSQGVSSRNLAESVLAIEIPSDMSSFPHGHEQQLTLTFQKLPNLTSTFNLRVMIDERSGFNNGWEEGKLTRSMSNKDIGFDYSVLETSHHGTEDIVNLLHEMQTEIAVESTKQETDSSYFDNSTFQEFLRAGPGRDRGRRQSLHNIAAPVHPNYEAVITPRCRHSTTDSVSTSAAAAAAAAAATMSHNSRRGSLTDSCYHLLRPVNAESPVTLLSHNRRSTHGHSSNHHTQPSGGGIAAIFNHCSHHEHEQHEHEDVGQEDRSSLGITKVKMTKTPVKATATSTTADTKKKKKKKSKSWSSWPVAIIRTLSQELSSLRQQLTSLTANQQKQAEGFSIERQKLQSEAKRKKQEVEQLRQSMSSLMLPPVTVSMSPRHQIAAQQQQSTAQDDNKQADDDGATQQEEDMLEEQHLSESSLAADYGLTTAVEIKPNKQLLSDLKMYKHMMITMQKERVEETNFIEEATARVVLASVMKAEAEINLERTQRELIEAKAMQEQLRQQLAEERANYQQLKQRSIQYFEQMVLNGPVTAVPALTIVNNNNNNNNNCSRSNSTSTSQESALLKKTISRTVCS